MHERLSESIVIILNKVYSGENFLRFELFCPTNGKIFCLGRLSKKTQNLPDLFDIGNVHLSPPRQGTLFFLKDFHPIFHHQNIPKNYTTFYHTCSWSKILSLNLPHIDNLHHLFSLTQKTLTAFNLSPQPHSIYLKTLYLFTRHEGYPIKEDWLTHLPFPLLNDALSILKNPLNAQTVSTTIIETLIHDIHSWISQKTDILLPN